MFEQARANSLANPILIRRKLPKQQAGDRVGRLAGPDRPRQYRRHDRRWRETIVTDHSIGFMDNKNGRETLLLVGQSSRFELAIERRLAAGKLREIMGRRQQLGAGDCQTSTPGF